MGIKSFLFGIILHKRCRKCNTKRFIYFYTGKIEDMKGKINHFKVLSTLVEQNRNGKYEYYYIIIIIIIHFIDPIITQ
jgi:hypothetical protein